jgi:hypothetical protein
MFAEAVRGIIRDAGINPGPAQDAEDGANPGVWNVVFLLLLIANLAFAIYLIPSRWMEGPHWDLLGKAIPAVGGSLFVIVASWYKSWTLKICKSAIFRISQVGLSVVFLFSLWIPWLRIQPVIAPGNAQVLVDEESDARKLGQSIWLSMKAHSFRVRDWPSGKLHERKFELTRKELLQAAFWGEQPHWALCYKVKFSSGTAGFKVRIVPDRASGFDKEFLKDWLPEHSLQMGLDNSLIFVLPSPEDSSGGTQLPMGKYKVVPFKSGCHDGGSQDLTVGPESNELMAFVDLKCD